MTQQEPPSRDRIHEAVCSAAGWPAYCDTCNAKMQRGPIGSFCSNHKECPSYKVKAAPPYYMAAYEAVWSEEYE